MSTDATAVSVAVPAADTVEKPPKRYQPPCWTHEETLALIEAYRERWYALRRGYLRTADWEAVAAAVFSRCPGASPAKTSAQCRHKMEKLRPRYRAEKQRAISYPDGRYFSTWVYFQSMDAMENGTTPPTNTQNRDGSGDGSGLRSLIDQNILKLKLKANNNVDLIPELGFDNGIKVKRSRSNSEMDMEGFDQYEEDPIDLGRRKAINPRSKSKNSGKMFNKFDVSNRYHQSMIPPGSRDKNIGKFDPIINSNNNVPHSNYEGFRVKVSNDGSKRVRNGVDEIVDSIRWLGEALVKMERAKMEMGREMEEMRMELEMKRSEMILQSQKQIVDAFAKGLIEMKKNKKKKKKVKRTDVITADSDPVET